MEIGKRIIFDKETGKVLNGCFDEMSGDIQDGLRPTEIGFIDLPFGDTTLNEALEYHVDVATKTIVIDGKVEHIKTDTEIIAELQNQLLESEGLI